MTMKQLVMSMGAVLLAATVASAGPYTVACPVESWDGAGWAACEQLERDPDQVGGLFDLSLFSSWSPVFSFPVLMPITSYAPGNTLTVDNGVLVYTRQPSHAPFRNDDETDQFQFAYWHYDTYTILGVEDLGPRDDNSDWDFNDYFARFEKIPTPDVPVPEPTTLVLLGLGLGLVARRVRKS